MNKRVLIVDDDPATCQLLAVVVSEFGVEVHDAGNDEEGYRRYLELGPDLMFIDVLLPRKGGLALLRRIRGVRGGKNVSVFVMSAVYRGGDIRTESVEELGALDFLKKPFQLDALRRRLAQLFASGEEEQEVLSPFASVEILSRGSLGLVDLPLLLRDLAQHETTGCLKLRAGKIKKVLYFEDGAITFAVSNHLRETLGRFLLDREVIDGEAYRRGLEAMREKGIKFGAFLVESEILSSDEMMEAVRQNVQEKILALFAWQEGDFHLTAHQAPPAVLPGPPFDALRLLWDGIQGPYPLAKIKGTLIPYSDFFILPQRDLFELASEIPLEKEDLQFLRIVRRLRGQTLGQVLAETRGEHEVRFLYYLLLRGYLALVRGGAEMQDGRLLDATQLDRIRRARRRLDDLRSRNHFQVLDVPLDASDEQVRAAYLQLAKDAHPDMLGPSDPAELIKVHEETFRAIQTAYEALKSEARRREYLKFLQEGFTEEQTDGSRILEAESLFQEGSLWLKRRNWGRAAKAFRDALELHPDEGEYALNLGIARMHQAAEEGPAAYQEAEQLFTRARDLMPTAAEPYYRLGRLAMEQNDVDRADHLFQAALNRRHDHVGALRELRLIKMRNQQEKGSVLGTLLGRKGAK